MDNPLKLKGWKSKNVEKVDFIQCPHCDYPIVESNIGIIITNDHTSQCPKCKRKFKSDELKVIGLKKEVAICSECGMKIPLTESYLDMISGFRYICPKCNNTVGIKFRSQVLQPDIVFKVSWNKNIKERAQKLNDKLFFAICKEKKDFIALMMMQAMAKHESDIGSHFFYIREKIQKSGLIFDENKIIGYIIWTEDKYATLRQIYIVSDERNKGYGTLLTKFWVENIANKINDKFIVETPNEKFNNILIKLGYAKREGNCIKGIKCSFVLT
ncbi:MAG: GNAT family N-acetyltransferase [Candidatus Aenigmatarchaeota archaeon]